MVRLSHLAMQDATLQDLVPPGGLDNRAHYDALVAEHGRDVRSVGWGSRASQRSRFAVFVEELSLDAGDAGGAGHAGEVSVLDVGCGLGDFYGYLQERSALPASYRGIDLSPNMIASARDAFGGERGVELAVEDILATSPERSYDYVVASGIFTYIGGENVELFHRLVEAMYARCTRALAFNSLSAWSPDPSEGEFRADPVETLRFASSLSSRLRLRTDYHARDVTVVVHRMPRAPA
jgi:SAM-dependent methyltransferase